MRLALALAIHLITLASLRAGWTFSPGEPQKAPPGLDFIQRKASDGGQTAELSIVSFSPRTHTFGVMDNPAGAFDAGSAALKRGALAAVNGGYFHPDRTPLGLVMRQGVEIHPLEKAKLLSGIVVVHGPVRFPHLQEPHARADGGPARYPVARRGRKSRPGAESRWRLLHRALGAKRARLLRTRMEECEKLSRHRAETISVDFPPISH